MHETILTFTLIFIFETLNSSKIQYLYYKVREVFLWEALTVLLRLLGGGGGGVFLTSLFLTGVVGGESSHIWDWGLEEYRSNTLWQISAKK